MKTFELTHLYFDTKEVITEETAPFWLKGNGKKSTMDNRWFWDDHVMTLKIGESVDTDFRRVKRIS
jgi:hypothetical protein